MRITGNPTVDRVLLGRAGNRLPSSYSDTFARADGALGGRWQGANWAITSGHAVGAPALGAELLTNGDMETGSPPAGWSANSSTLASDGDVHAGSQSIRVTNTANGSASRGISTEANRWYAYEGWSKSGSVNGNIRVYQSSPFSLINASLYGSVTYTLLRCYFRASSNATSLFLNNGDSVASHYALFDDVSVRPITLSSMLSGIRMARPYLDVSAAAYRVVGTQFGVFSCLDSLTTPANGVFAYLDGAGNIKLDKLVAGTWTNVASVAMTYAAGALVRVKQVGSTFTIYYNGTQLGTTSTISDAGVINNVVCGLMSTYSGNYATSFSATPAA